MQRLQRAAFGYSIVEQSNQTKEAAEVQSGGECTSGGAMKRSCTYAGVFALGRGNGQPHLLRQHAGDEAADAVGLPAECFHQFLQARPAWRIHQSDRLLCLTALALRLCGRPAAGASSLTPAVSVALLPRAGRQPRGYDIHHSGRKHKQAIVVGHFSALKKMPLGADSTVMGGQFINFLKDEGGQDLVEYSLLLAFLALATIGLLTNARTSLNGLWGTVSRSINTANTTAAS
jgi:Flp pilus assembly pilin Flp